MTVEWSLRYSVTLSLLLVQAYQSSSPIPSKFAPWKEQNIMQWKIYSIVWVDSGECPMLFTSHSTPCQDNIPKACLTILLRYYHCHLIHHW